MEPQRQVPRSASNPNVLNYLARTDVFAKTVDPSKYIECPKCRQPVIGGLTEGGRRTWFDPATRVDHTVTCPNQ
jgi:hypothetical protein